MKTKFAILAMTGLALVAGCNRGSTNSSANSANGSVTNNSAAAAPAAAPAAGGTPVTQASLVGTWGQDNCSNTMSFAADGKATSSGATSDNVRWALDGGNIVITAPGQPETRMGATMSGENLQLTNQGQTMLMSKCPAPAGAAAQAEATEEASEATE
jgi:hypothetical protein